jgi:pullulanase
MCSAPLSDAAGSAKLVDSLVSTKELGCIVQNGHTTFRLFAPRAISVKVVLFDRYDQKEGAEFEMVHDTSDGVWEYSAKRPLYGTYYGYRVSGPAGPGEMFDSSIVIGDPYSKAVATLNDYRMPSKTLILDTRYDWEGDTSLAPRDHNRLIIYEAHLRDLTADTSSGVTAAGTYLGMIEKGKRGGLSYLKDLGVNAIEFLPLQKFCTIELPYRDSSMKTDLGEVNTWNPYERNHWGYMTSFYFAPETYYASDGTMERGRYNGTDGRAVREMKDMVKALHHEGFAVLMDVVYNHVSQYDYNPFKYIDKFYYFRTDSSGNFMRASGCGNDFRTESPMARRLIIESVTYWMKEYHIDGFRFDIAAMIDRETCKQILAAARAINPNVIIIAEPWGGGRYEPAGFSDIGWAAWNDQIRNGAKGRDPHTDPGFIFGKFQGGNTKTSVKGFVAGTLRKNGGLFLHKDESINYLESHDDNTMGDFIRLATGTVNETERITDVNAETRLTPRELALNKLGAMFLLASQGPVMIAEGQEYARGKVIAPTAAPDTNIGRIDHNSYEKDNATNWLNYNQKELNADLYEYYKQLIRLRTTNRVFSNAPDSGLTFLTTRNDFCIAYRLDSGARSTPKKRLSFIVILNGDPLKTSRVTLPKGSWSVIADGARVSPDRPVRNVTGKSVTVPPTSGMILITR